MLTSLTLTWLALLATTPSEPADSDDPSANEVRVHLVSDAPLAELRRVGGHYTGMGFAVGARGLQPAVVSGAFVETLCTTPCGVTLNPIRGRLHVAGPGITPSDEFSLASYTGDVTLNVKTGSFYRRIAGIQAIVWGSLGLATGATMGILGTVRSRPGLAKPGWLVAGISAPLVVLGGVLVNGTSTQVDIRGTRRDLP
jgi:hypothetical protein